VSKPTTSASSTAACTTKCCTSSDDRQPSLDQAELAAAIRGRRDAEATVAQLQAELSTAARARTEAELARTEAEKAARQARTDAEVAYREFAAARDYANAAKAEIDRLMAAGGTPPSSVNIIVLIGICATAILLLVIWVLSRLRSALPSHPVDAGRADAASEERNDDSEGALVRCQQRLRARRKNGAEH
jgi:cobalamin biosynthesis Mg chelatase CobN